MSKAASDLLGFQKKQNAKFKTGFVAANNWKQQTGNGLLENGEEKSVADYINKICPHFDSLEEIFGQRRNVQIQGIYETNNDIEVTLQLSDTFSAASGFTNQMENEPEVEEIPLLDFEPPECPTITPVKTKAEKKRKINPLENLLKLQEKRIKILEERETNALKIKEMEVKFNLETRKLELESEERIKKYEIDRKYSRSTE